MLHHLPCEENYGFNSVKRMASAGIGLVAGGLLGSPLENGKLGIAATVAGTIAGCFWAARSAPRSTVRTMSAKEAKDGFGSLLDTAWANPVTIDKYGRPVVVVLSNGEYKRPLNRSGCKKAAKTRRDNESGRQSP